MASLCALPQLTKCLVSLSCHADHRALHSFPTRRSSDLLQRLTLLKKNHLDEQYVARRNVRDLPGIIASLSERLSQLTADEATDRKSTRLNSSHTVISYAVFCLKKKNHMLDAS